MWFTYHCDGTREAYMVMFDNHINVPLSCEKEMEEIDKDTWIKDMNWQGHDLGHELKDEIHVFQIWINRLHFIVIILR